MIRDLRAANAVTDAIFPIAAGQGAMNGLGHTSP